MNLGVAPPQFVIDAVAAGIDDQAREGFRQTGRNIGSKLLHVPSFLATPGASAPGPWERLIAPIVDPLTEGVTEEITPKVIGIAAILVGAGAALGYFMRGRR